jgi:DNA-directed RNA polymerase alpha subunit
MDRRRWRVVVDGEPSRANAARRALISSLRSVAPDRVEIDVNTSAHTDEYIAQRLGLLPFRRGAVTAASCVPLRVRGRPVRGSDVDGAAHPDAELLPMGHGQEVALRMRFAEGTGATHARFARAVAVGMRPVEGGGEADPPRHAIDFEALTDDDCPRAMWSEALDALDALLSRAEEEVRRRG